MFNNISASEWWSAIKTLTRVIFSHPRSLSLSSEHSLTWPGHWQATTGITRTLGWIGGIKYAISWVWNEYLYLLRGKYWICPVTRSRPGGLIWLGSVCLSGPHYSLPINLSLFFPGLLRLCARPRQGCDCGPLWDDRGRLPPPLLAPLLLLHVVTPSWPGKGSETNVWRTCNISRCRHSEITERSHKDY